MNNLTNVWLLLFLSKGIYDNQIGIDYIELTYLSKSILPSSVLFLLASSVELRLALIRVFTPQSPLFSKKECSDQKTYLAQVT